MLKTGEIPSKKRKKLPLSEYDRYAIANRRVSAKADNEIVLSAPVSASEVESMIDEFRMGNSILVSFSKLGSVEYTRILDAMSGALNALGGNVVNISDRLYLFAVKDAKIVCKIG